MTFSTTLIRNATTEPCLHPFHQPRVRIVDLNETAKDVLPPGVSETDTSFAVDNASEVGEFCLCPASIQNRALFFGEPQGAVRSTASLWSVILLVLRHAQFAICRRSLGRRTLGLGPHSIRRLGRQDNRARLSDR